MEVRWSAVPRSTLRSFAVGIVIYLVWPGMNEIFGLEGELWRSAATLVVGLLVLAFSILRVAHGPRPGEYWMARVPFADRPGARERPCLVIKSDGDMRTVLFITSQDMMSELNYMRINTASWTGKVPRQTTWMRVSEYNGSDPSIPVDLLSFRYKLGEISPRDAAELKSRSNLVV